ncbi:MAG: hypothetical protein QW291_09265, partial [Thermofilaceae archaeon]
MRARGKMVLAAALVFLLAEVPLAFAPQTYGSCTYGMPHMGCPFGGGGGDVGGLVVGTGLVSLPFVLEEVMKQLEQANRLAPVVQQPTQQPGVPTGIIEQPRQAGGLETGAARVDPQQQVRIAESILIQRDDATLKSFRDQARKKGWIVKETEGMIEIDKRELLEFMRANEGKLRNLLGRDYDEVYKDLQNGPRPKLYRKLDLLLEGKGKRVYVEEKNLATLSANKLHVLKELIIDLYLNLVRGVKVVWHFSSYGSSEFYSKIISVLRVFGVEY